jgi:hypothetical protein
MGGGHDHGRAALEAMTYERHRIDAKNARIRSVRSYKHVKHLQ